jgi:hypothetical protein
MDTVIYYFDKLTAWLDLSWLITVPKQKDSMKKETIYPPVESYVVDPYVIDPFAEQSDYEVEPLLR